MELERGGGTKKYGIYAFRSPLGFMTHSNADFGFMMNEIQTGQPGIGYSYRFIGMSEGITEDQVFDFREALSWKRLRKHRAAVL